MSPLVVFFPGGSRLVDAGNLSALEDAVVVDAELPPLLGDRSKKIEKYIRNLVWRTGSGWMSNKKEENRKKIHEAKTEKKEKRDDTDKFTPSMRSDRSVRLNAPQTKRFVRLLFRLFVGRLRFVKRGWRSRVCRPALALTKRRALQWVSGTSGLGFRGFRLSAIF